MLVAFSWTDDKRNVRFAVGEFRSLAGATATTFIPEKVICTPKRMSFDEVGGLATGPPSLGGKSSPI
jgi:hypothetical protein